MEGTSDMPDIKHETKQNASYTAEAIALADTILKAAGSGLQHYSMAKTRNAILTAAQQGLNAAKSAPVESLQAILPYAKNEIGFINLRNDGDWKDEAEAREANNAIAQAEAVITDTAEAEGVLLHSDETRRLLNAAPKLLAACRMVVERWERGDLAEAARACQEAIDEATDDLVGRAV